MDAKRHTLHIICLTEGLEKEVSNVDKREGGREGPPLWILFFIYIFFFLKNCHYFFLFTIIRLFAFPVSYVRANLPPPKKKNKLFAPSQPSSLIILHMDSLRRRTPLVEYVNMAKNLQKNFLGFIFSKKNSPFFTTLLFMKLFFLSNTFG